MRGLTWLIRDLGAGPALALGGLIGGAMVGAIALAMMAWQSSHVGRLIELPDDIRIVVLDDYAMVCWRTRALDVCRQAPIRRDEP